MTGTRKKASEMLLKAAIVVCVLFTLSHLAGAVMARIPPYKPGQCLEIPNPLIILKVKANHVFAGYSDVGALFLLNGEEVGEGPIPFSQLRDPVVKPTECPK